MLCSGREAFVFCRFAYFPGQRQNLFCRCFEVRNFGRSGRVFFYTFLLSRGNFYNLPRTALWVAKRSIGMFRLMLRDVIFGWEGAGGEKASGSKVQKRVEGKGRKKERSVRETEIRKTGGRGKGRKKGGRKKEAAGKKECGVTPKDGEKRKTVERGKGRNGRKKENGKRNGMKQNRKYLTKNKILHMVATYLTIINFAYEFNFISAVV